jgi:hypothetical protein
MGMFSWIPRSGWEKRRTLPVPIHASFRSYANARRFAATHERMGYSVRTVTRLSGRTPVWEVDVS